MATLAFTGPSPAVSRDVLQESRSSSLCVPKVADSSGVDGERSLPSMPSVAKDFSSF